MNPLNVVTFCAFALTAIALYFVAKLPFLPPWAIFIAWACFFHLDGGANRNQAYLAVVTHLGLGTLAAWLSAIVLLLNPFSSELAADWWGPVLIGAVIAVITRLGTMPRFSITPAIIYGYASFFAFAGTTGYFSLDRFLSLSFTNGLIAVVVCQILGATAGYVNVLAIETILRFGALRKKPDAASIATRDAEAV